MLIISCLNQRLNELTQSLNNNSGPQEARMHEAYTTKNIKLIEELFYKLNYERHP